MNDVQMYTDRAVELAMTHGPGVIQAILVLIIGLWVIRLVLKGIDRAMERSNIDVSLRKFLRSLVSIGLKAMLIISVAAMVGIETTSFVAVIGAAGLAVGLALQGTLSNFAGGVLILLFKPYTVGDVVEAAGYTGKVHEIQIFTTVLKTPDNKTIIIPNGELSNSSLTNYSTEATRRVDMVFGIGYEDDIAKAKAVLNRLIAEDDRILKDPEHQVVVGELADSSVNFKVRVWCNAADYWSIYFDMHEKVKLTFDAEGLSIPFPQQDVHMHQVS